MLLNPLIRFGLGYFMTIPSLFSGYTFLTFKQRNKYYNYFPKVVYVVTLIMLFWRTGNNIDDRVFLPAKLPLVELKSEQINNVNYYYPDNWTSQCWSAKLPCSNTPMKINIELISPKKGIKGGFQWKN